MGSFEENLKKINELGGNYEMMMDAKRRELYTAMEAQNETANIVKWKIQKLEESLTRNMPFPVI